MLQYLIEIIKNNMTKKEYIDYKTEYQFHRDLAFEHIIKEIEEM